MPIEENIEPVITDITDEVKSNPSKGTIEQKEALLLSDDFVASTGCDKWSDPEKAHFIEKGFRTFRLGEKPIISTVVRPTDYQHDLKRGTLEYDERIHNYAFCNVVIPDGSVLVENNFAQVEPNTDCIVGENLTFVGCNLGNVKLNPSWILTECNTAQYWIVEEDVEGKPAEKRQFICSRPDELPDISKDIPANVILTRDY